LWDQPKLTTFNGQNIISAIQMRIDQLDSEVRMAELSLRIKEVLQSNVLICNLTQSLLDRAGTKCDGINLLLESKQLYDEGSKEYQIVAIKKYKAEEAKQTPVGFRAV
jgi:GTP-sensing pleiotropic transcriptional regulator CodY